MGAAALPLIVGGTILQAGAQFQAGQAAEDAAQFNRARAKQNAIAVQVDSRKKAERARQAGAELKSTQKAAFGKSGVLLTGTPQDVFAETERTTQMDVEAILTAGDIGSREQLAQAEQFGREAAAASRAKTIAPLATLVSGGGQAALATR